MNTPLIVFLALVSLPRVQDEERSVKELRRDYPRTEEVEERTLILLELAQHAISDPKQAKAAWEGVAVALQDDAYALRREAIRLLLLAPEREPAVKYLTAALQDAADGRGLISQGAFGGRGAGAARGGRGGRAGGGAAGGAGGGGEGEAQEGEGAGQDEGAEAPPNPLDAFRATMAEANGYVEELIAGVGKLPDDRSVRAMLSFFEKAQGRLLGRYKLAAADGLGALASRPAIEALQAAFEDAVDTFEKEQQQAERAGDPPPGRGRGGGRGIFGGGGGPDASEMRERLHAVLSAAAKRAEIEPIPDLDEDAVRNWKKLLAKNRGAFPAKLGKISPLDSEG